jgi:pimeloyl-ACP methyl ester carboxylesterase
MFAPLPLLAALVLARGPDIDSKFEQVAPIALRPTRSEGQTRAVVLIHGYHVQFRKETVHKAEFRPWQKPEAVLVKELARDADVYVFAYGQDATLDNIITSSGLGDDLARLRQLGYREMVVVGHSAGGLIARQYVEDHPDCGVNKVVQIGSPNGGCPTAATGIKVLKSQQVFLDCLTIKGRQACLRARGDIRIPERVQFVCVVTRSKDTGTSDGLVPCHCQWTEDLQKQGIPAVVVNSGHREVVRNAKGAQVLSDVIRKDQRRWDSDQVRKMQKELFPKMVTSGSPR